jgi:DNA-binding NarL/FixJ family response regulator
MIFTEIRLGKGSCMIASSTPPRNPGSGYERIRVIIADDHPVVRNGIKTELARYEDIEVIGEAVDGDESLERAIKLQPDVLLLDINMPGMRAIDVVRELSMLNGKTRVLVLSAFGDLEYILAMLKAGANGYMLKDEEPTTIAKGIRTISKGETWLSADVATRLVFASVRNNQIFGKSELTSRENEVLVLIAKGYDNRKIAELLTISEGTVKNHVSNIYDKIGVNSRAEAVAWAWEHGLVKPQEDS